MIGRIYSSIHAPTPADEADLLSSVYFDRYFTAQLVELGRADASAHQDRILELLAG